MKMFVLSSFAANAIMESLWELNISARSIVVNVRGLEKTVFIKNITAVIGSVLMVHVVTRRRFEPFIFIDKINYE